ncbi:MAG: glycosyltransferase family 4 protein [Candidatus Binatia bacterium]
MRLALWCTSYFAGFGGAEKFVNDLLNRFAARGIETFLIAGESERSSPDNPRYAPLYPAVRIYQNTFLNPFDYLGRPHVFVLKLFQYITAAIQVGFFLRKNKIDVVHLHFVSFDVLLLLLYKYLLRYRLVITFTGSDIHLAARNNFAGLKVRFALKHADCVTAVSQDLCAKLAALFGANPLYVPNGVDREQLRHLGAVCPSPVDDDHLIYCGRLTPVKRVPFLIVAFYQCLARGCERKLYIVGDGEEALRIKALIASYGLEDKVICVGALPHEQVVSAISRSRCLLLSSSSEGCPMVALESLALGRPVIAPDVGGLKDILIHGENGYLYPADRQDLLREAIMSVAGNRTLAGLLGSKGPASIAGKFELDAVVGHYCQIYGAMTHKAD